MSIKKITLLFNAFLLLGCTSTKKVNDITNSIEQRPSRVLLEDENRSLYQEFKNNVSNEVYFGFDSFNLLASEKLKLMQQAEWILHHPGVVIIIEGGTDDIGKQNYNNALALKRAYAVKNFLIKHGVNKDKILCSCISEEMKDSDSMQNKKKRSLSRKATTIVKQQSSNNNDL